jgi:acyl-CoA thioesterase FadM
MIDFLHTSNTNGNNWWAMNLYLRLLTTWIRTLCEKPISTYEDCVQKFRVWPSDIDIFMHMNDGRYLQIMDVARFRWLLRTGIIAAVRRNRWRVALGGNMIRYRRPLKLLQPFRVRTHVRCWDDKWFFLEHSIHTMDGAEVAFGICRAAFRGKGAWIKTNDVVAAVEPGRESSGIPEYIQRWMDYEGRMR